jgi:hypothetical protein
MRRITATIGALVLMTGVLLGTTGAASGHAESAPGATCVGSSLAMWTATALCVVDRNYPILITPGA